MPRRTIPGTTVRGVGSDRAQPDLSASDRAAVVALAEAGELTYIEIAEQCGCSRSTVDRWLRQAGVPPRQPGRLPLPLLTDRDALAALIASGLTTAQIGERVGRSTNVIRKWIGRHGLDYPRHRNRPARAAQLDDAEWLRREHHERGRSVCAIARQFGCSRTVVTLRFRAFGIPIRSQTTYPPLRDAAWLEERYAAGQSSRTIAREVGCSDAAVRLAAISLGVTPLGRSRTGRPSVDELRRVWAESGVVRVLARRYHRSDATVAGWLDDAGIERKRRQLRA